MAITRTAMVDDDGSGTTGTIINNAWKTEFYNQIDGALGSAGGNWLAHPFAAGDFGALGGGTWTVGAGAYTQNRFTVIGKIMHWAPYIYWGAGASTIAGAVTTLTMRLPGGYTTGNASGIRLAQFYVAGVLTDGFAFTGAGSTTISIAKADSSALAAGQVGFYSLLTLEIQ